MDAVTRVPVPINEPVLDYAPGSRSVVFYGSQFRPQTGDNVVISYRVWEGSLG